MTFEEWFQSQNFRHFGAGEFTRYFNVKRYGVRNAPPPSSLWENIVPTLRLVDTARDYFDKPITITSSYRCPSYNRACGGAANSQHLQFRALDIQCKDTTPHELVTFLRALRSGQKFQGGLGLYPTFVHIDTRGYNADW